jgi:glycosyltransferase involved in cell wall biosynthesis
VARSESIMSSLDSVKVLHFFKTHLPDTFGGVEQVIEQIADGATAMGVESRVLTLSPFAKREARISRKSYEIVRCPFSLELASTRISFGVIPVYSEMASWADVVHLHFPWPFADCVHLWTRCRKPLIITYHSDIVRQKMLAKLYAPLMCRLFHRARYIVATSPNYAVSSKVLSKWQSKVKTIPLGLNESSYQAPSADARKRWASVVGGGPFFLFIGVFRYYKGLKYLIDALEGTGMRAVFVGGGKQESDLRMRARKLAVGQVVFTGIIAEADKIALLSLCLGVVLPSCERSEAFGVALIEGAMFGKPLVSCEIATGTSFVNIHGKTGFVVEPANSISLRSAMQTLWDSAPLRKTMGHNARNRFEELFVGKKMVSNYVSLYTSVKAEI